MRLGFRAAKTLPSADELVALIEAHGLRVTSEAVLQQALEELFRKHGIGFEREAWITAEERVDFLVGGIGLEVKTKGSLSEVLRQLHRYAQSSFVEEILLVTSRLQHLRLPESISGKPVRVASLMPGLL